MLEFNENVPILSERFPHILTKIKLMWGTPELDYYLSQLSNREYSLISHGLPPEVMSELHMISVAHVNRFKT